MTRERLEQTGGTAQALGIKSHNNVNTSHPINESIEEKVNHSPQTSSPVETVTSESEVQVIPKRRWWRRTGSFYERSDSLFQVHRTSSNETVDLVKLVAKL